MASSPSSPYLTSDYFTPYYYSLSAPLVDEREAPQSLYFELTFFSPYYFPPFVPLDNLSGTICCNDKCSDTGIFSAIIAILRNTNQFAAVQYGVPWEKGKSVSSTTPMALVTPRSWSESELTDSNLIVRTLKFTISLIVYEMVPELAFSALDSLAALVCNVLNHAQVNHSAVPSMSSVKQGTFESATDYPETRSVLEVEWVYLIEASNLHYSYNYLDSEQLTWQAPSGS